MATVAQLEAALMKADAAGDEAAAREIAAEIKRTRSRTAKPTKQRAKAGRLESVVSGIERGLQPFAEFAERINPLSYILPAEQSPATRQRLQTQARQAQQDRPNYFAGGKIAGEIAATVPLISAGGGLISAGGRALGTVAPRVAPVVQRFGQAVSSGGIGVQAPTRAGRVGLKVAGGGTAGAAGAALTGQDVTEGALFGAGIPVVGSVLKRLGGKTVDLARLPAVKAGQIIREALGKDVDAAKAAFSALSADDQRLAQQVLIDAGVEPSPFFGIGSIVAREIDPDTPAAILARQAAEREARMAAISGGETATARRGAIDVERRAVNEATGPAREAALGAIKDTNIAVSEAERLAAAARAQADEQSGLARRMTLGAERAETRLGQMDDLGDVFNPAAVARERGLAGAMTQRGEEAAQGAIGLRQTARDMDDIVAELASQNREPLLAAPLVATLRQQAEAEGVRTSSARRALLKLASQIEGATDQNGMLNPYDLYTLRKEASDIVEKYVASSAQPSTGSKKRAAGLVIGFKNAVDEALGPEFKDYLVQHQRGMQNVNIQELTARGAQLAKESPDEFIALMRGERPKIVEDVYGKGTNQFDIAGMALADPRRYTAMMQTADELQSLNRMRELASLGETAGGNLLTREQPGYLSRGIRGVVGAKFPAVAYAGQGLNQVQRAIMSPKVQQELAAAYQSGPAMAAAMNQFPTAVRMSEQVRQQLSPSSRNAIAQLLNQYLNQ
jgi:hypothetical protein